MAFETADQVGGQERQHAGPGRLDDVLPEAREGDATRAALVDERRDAGAHAAQVRVQAESSGHALVYVGVRVDEARQDEAAAAIDNLRIRADRRVEIGADSGDPAAVD